MLSNELPTALFIEGDPDNYILTSEEEVALGAAWQVLQAFELNERGSHQFYDDNSRDSTLGYLREGGEERPINGIFAVEVRQSLRTDNQLDLLVSNRNGRGDEGYRGILRAAVQTIGIVES